MDKQKKEEPLLTHSTKGVCNASADSAEPTEEQPAIRRREPLSSPGLLYDPMDDEGFVAIGRR